MKIKFSTSLFWITHRVINWLIQVSFPELIGFLPLLDKLLLKLDKGLKSRGLRKFVPYLKEVRTVWLNYLAGITLSGVSIKTTSDGIPKIFGDLIHIIRKGKFPVSLLQILNTILFCTRSIKEGGKFTTDLSSIEGPPIKEYPLHIEKHIRSFWRDLGYRSPSKVPSKRLQFKSFKLSTAAGPVPGKYGNATWTSIFDLFSLIDNSQLLNAIKIVGGPKLTSSLDNLINGLDIIQRKWKILYPSPLRRLVSFPDKEFKVRTVAILDYFSQSSLRPLHSFLFSCLKNIKQDVTFDQSSFKHIALSWETYSSVDLTAATDRFPIKLEAAVLKGVIPSTYVDAWEQIMIGTPFEFNNRMISYSVGNPMGAYSSFASFAVSHHYIVYYCCKELGLPWRKAPYFLLGDDIIIGDDRLSALYKEVISSLGLEFSKLKTYDSPHFFEFTKRIFWKGSEISPFPISALKEESKYYYLLTNLLVGMESKGYQFVNGVSSGVQSYYSMVKSLPSRFTRDIKDKSYICELIIKIINGSLPAAQLNKAMQALGYTFLPELSNKECSSILENIIVEEFANSNPASNIFTKRKSIGLGLLAISWVEYLTGLPDNEIGRGIPLIYDLPILNAYARIEDFYIKLSKKALTFKEWPLALKTLAIPWDDKIFFKTESHLIVKSSLTIISSLRNRAEILQLYPKLRDI
nr:MAG: putative RNA dependent RNA polymerase [Yunnan mito-like virus 53]